jgi:glucarate dehydratase
MAAMIHLGAAVPNLLYASDTHYPWNPDDIIKGPMFEIKDGYLDVPTGPGLGVELDEEKLAKYAEAYQKRRSHARDDVSAMRERYADWLPLKPRW